MVLREDGYWLFYTGFSDISPPENFLIPANKTWCEEHAGPCMCFEEEPGIESCLLESVMTLNLARRGP